MNKTNKGLSIFLNEKKLKNVSLSIISEMRYNKDNLFYSFKNNHFKGLMHHFVWKMLNAMRPIPVYFIYSHGGYVALKEQAFLLDFLY